MSVKPEQSASCLASTFAKEHLALVCFIIAGEGDNDIVSVADAFGVEL